MSYDNKHSLMRQKYIGNEFDVFVVGGKRVDPHKHI